MNTIRIYLTPFRGCAAGLLCVTFCIGSNSISSMSSIGMYLTAWGAVQQASKPGGARTLGGFSFRSHEAHPCRAGRQKTPDMSSTPRHRVTHNHTYRHTQSNTYREKHPHTYGHTRKINSKGDIREIDMQPQTHHSPTRTCTQTHMWMHTHTHTHTYTHTRIQTHTHTHTHTQTHKYTHALANTHTQTHTNTHTHTHLHVHKHSVGLPEARCNMERSSSSMAAGGNNPVAGGEPPDLKEHTGEQIMLSRSLITSPVFSHPSYSHDITQFQHHCHSIEDTGKSIHIHTHIRQKAHNHTHTCLYLPIKKIGTYMSI